MKKLISTVTTLLDLNMQYPTKTKSKGMQKKRNVWSIKKEKKKRERETVPDKA